MEKKTVHMAALAAILAVALISGCMEAMTGGGERDVREIHRRWHLWRPCPARRSRPPATPATAARCRKRDGPSSQSHSRALLSNPLISSARCAATNATSDVSMSCTPSGGRVPIRGGQSRFFDRRLSRRELAAEVAASAGWPGRSRPHCGFSEGCGKVP